MRHHDREQRLGAIRRDHHGGTLEQPGQDVLHRHARDHDPLHLAGEQFVAAAQQRAAHRVDHGRDRRSDEGHLLGHGPDRNTLRHDGRDLRLDLLDSGGIRPVHEQRQPGGVRGAQFVQAELGDLRQVDRGSRARLAERLGPVVHPAAEDEHHRGVQVRGDPRVERELGRHCDIGEVAADDDDRVASGPQRLIGGDDPGECGLRILVRLLVGDPDAGLVGRLRGGPRAEQLEHAIALRPAADQRPEDPDTGRIDQEGVEHAERHRALARSALGGGEVEGCDHAISLAAADALLLCDTQEPPCTR